MLNPPNPETLTTWQSNNNAPRPVRNNNNNNRHRPGKPQPLLRYAAAKKVKAFLLPEVVILFSVARILSFLASV